MKSADSNDQLSGISDLLIYTYLAKIESLISFLDLPI
jgi:hypothetical protein